MTKIFSMVAVAVLSVATVLGGCCGPQESASTAASPVPVVKPVVVIVKGDDPKEMMARAIELLGGLESIVGDAKTIVLKPNLTGMMGSEYKGVSTSGEVMGALFGELKKADPQAKLTVAEGPGGGSIEWIVRATNMAEPVKEYDVEVINTNTPTTPRVKVDLPNGLAYKSYEYPEVVKNADIFINVPVMKTHQLSGITVGFKNLFGYFPGGPSGQMRAIYHDRYSDALIDMYTIRKPDLIVVDALRGMEGRGPLWGRIVEHNLIIVGTDMVAVDTVCGALMGQPIERIPYTNKAASLGLGVADLKHIEIRGEKIEDVKKDYEQPRWYVGLQIPRTEEAIARIEELCDGGTEEYLDRRDNTVSCKVYHFKDTNLKPDLAKHPLRQNTGFDVYMYMKRETGVIEFQTRYNLYYDDLRQAAEDETRAWIMEKLNVKSEDIQTLPLGGDWHGRKE